MAFVTDDDLRAVIRDQILNNLVDQDNTLKQLAISEAISKVKMYLRTRYDVEGIFEAEGEERNMMVVALVRDMALFYMSKRQNPRAVPEHIKDVHDEAIRVLVDIQNGKANPDLPPLPEVDGEEQKGSNRVRYGSLPVRARRY